MKLTANHADTCLPCYWGGHHLPHVQIIVHNGMTLGEVKRALNDELNQGAIAGVNAPQEDDEAWFAAARLAVSELEAAERTGDDVPLFNDLEEEEEDDCGESVYAFFVFTEEE